MRAAVLAQPGSPLVIEERPDPTPAPGELVLRVDACGICGSDLHFSDTFGAPGSVMGHEFCGTVAAVGADVDGWKEGDAAVGLSLTTCGRCAACLAGRPRQCSTKKMVGIDTPGAYAEYIAVPAHDTWPMPERLDHRHGALVEPLAIGLHAVARAGIEPGDDVLVVGGGPIGAAVAVWLRHAGAGEIVVSDPVDHRRELAERVGATATVDPTAEDVASACARICGGPPPVVIECVGIPGLIQHATDLAADAGRVVVAGVCMQPDTIMPVLAMMKELDLRYALYYRSRDYRHTIAMLDHGRIDPLPLVTGEVDLDGLPGRFESLKSPTTDCKVLLRP